MTKSRSNAVANAAKGDLTVGSGTNLSGVLGVGSNGDTIVADSSTATGLRYQGSQAAGKNYAINGAMEIWQRGTSFTPSAVGYCADRWSFNNNSAATLSRQTTSLTGFQYALRVQRNSGSTSTSQISVYESLETVSIYPLIGQTVTLSFWARAGANYSPTSSLMGAYLYSGTGTDQNIHNGYTSAAVVAGGNTTITTTWTRYSVSGTVGSSITELALGFTHNPVGTAGANDWFEVTGVQLELGSVATAFTRAGGTIQGELAACQRYFQTERTGNTPLGTAAYWTSTLAYLPYVLKTTMRVAPTVTFDGVAAVAVFCNGVSRQSTAIGTDTVNVNFVEIVPTTGAVTGGDAAFVRLNVTDKFINFSAEL